MSSQKSSPAPFSLLPFLEKCQLTETFWTGEIETRLSCGGRPLPPQSEWRLTCEEFDDSRFYWEFAQDWPRQKRLERHLLYAPDESALLIADALVPAEDARLPRGGEQIDYELKISLADRVCVPKTALPTAPQPSESEEASEILLTLRRASGKPSAPPSPVKSARIFPLALNEWQENNAPEEGLRQTENALLLRLTHRGNALFAPLFFDLDPKRIKKRYTWRRLTVGEKMERVPEDKAVGFRVQCGGDQYLLYRSLQGQGLRSVLGEHFYQEFVFAKFAPYGETENIIEIIPDAMEE